MPNAAQLTHRLDSPRAKAAFVLILLAVCSVNTWSFLRSMEDRKPTLKRWLPYAAELGLDDRLYDDHPDYLYPPFFLVLLRPLTHLPPTAAAILWQGTKYACAIGIFALAWNLLARAGPLPFWAKLLAVIVSLRFIFSDLSHGNLNLFIACGVTLAAWLLFSRRPWLSGLVLAAVACIKLTPALWAVYLLYKRRWCAVGGFVIGAVLALEIVPLLVLPPQQTHTLLVRWHGHVVRSFVTAGHINSSSINQSFAAVSNRLLGRSEWAPDEAPIAPVDLNDHAITWVQRVVAVALLAALAWACRGPLPLADPLAFSIEWSLVAPVTLALSGYTWTSHFCVLVFSIATLFTCLARPLGSSRRDRPVFVPGVAGAVLLVMTSDVITSAGRRWALAYGLPLLGALLVGVALVAARRRLRAEQLREQRRDNDTEAHGAGGPESAGGSVDQTRFPSVRGS